MQKIPSSHSLKTSLIALLGVMANATTTHAVLFDSTGNPSFNTSAPTGPLNGSGWQYQGLWGGGLGTPIAPNYFITAAHIGGAIGQSLSLGGNSYVTDAFYTDTASDLRIWRITGTFADYAPLYTRSDEAGKDLVVFGRGAPRGGDVMSGANLAGWFWGASTGTKRWGTNTVTSIIPLGAGLGDMLYAEFDHIGGTEAHLSPSDSGGGLFILDTTDNTWKLAGINYGVDSPFHTSSTGGGAFNAALFDTTGFYGQTGPTTFVPLTGPSGFYSTRISADQSFIYSVIPEPGASGVIIGLLVQCCAFIRVRRRMPGPCA